MRLEAPSRVLLPSKHSSLHSKQRYSKPHQNLAAYADNVPISYLKGVSVEFWIPEHTHKYNKDLKNGERRPLNFIFFKNFFSEASLNIKRNILKGGAFFVLTSYLLLNRASVLCVLYEFILISKSFEQDLYHCIYFSFNPLKRGIGHL